MEYTLTSLLTLLVNSGIIAVGATDIHDNIGNFSAQGPHIDISAPGVGIWSTNFNNGYIDLSGTSQATPYVAGLASLLKGFNTNLANDDIEQIIRLTADDRGAVGFDNMFGAGRINALRALQSLQAPNTLQQLNTTGGTIFSTSGSMTRIFLGVPGFADAAYVVKRSEVRKAIALPAICNRIGVWGRGIGTTGLREENGRCFGEGICEVVPGTLTNTSCTLRTYIYEVWTVLGQYVGFYPRSASNVVFQYTVLGTPAPSLTINGSSELCSSATYTVNAPAGSAVVWSATSSLVNINAATGYATKVSDGSAIITATVTFCPGVTSSVTKQVSVGYPNNYYIQSIYPVTGGVNVYPSFSGQQPAVTSWNIYIDGSFSTSGSGYPPSVITAAGGTTCGNHTVTLNVYNNCGSSSTSSSFSRGCFALTPNPANGDISITDMAANSKSASKGGKVTITVFDNTNRPLKQFNFTQSSHYNFSVADLTPGTYIVQIKQNGYVKKLELIKQ